MDATSDFDAFYLATRGQLLRQLTAMTADPEQAADVLQEAFARAWQRWARVSRLDDPAAWVRTVAWHRAVSAHRRQQVALRFLPRLGATEQSAPVRSEERLDVAAALSDLSPEHRRVLVLHELVGMGVADVAAETGVPEGTVKSRLSRARQRLAEALGEDYVVGSDSPGPAERGGSAMAASAPAALDRLGPPVPPGRAGRAARSGRGADRPDPDRGAPSGWGHRLSGVSARTEEGR